MIGFAGLSHLGVNSCAAAAARGEDVIAFDEDAALCSELAAGRPPFYEPGLVELLTGQKAGIRFTADAGELAKCDLVYFSLDTPTDKSNRSDTGLLEKLVARVLPSLSAGTTLVFLSQVPPGFTRRQAGSIAQQAAGKNLRVFCQVETLIFGNAVDRALNPERFIVGCAEPSEPLPERLQQYLGRFGCPILPMRYESAELAKISINAFLVASVATTNTLAEICEAVGADWAEIAPALRLDKRIGPHAYLAPGLGLAGGNLERDLITLLNLGAEHGTETCVVSAWLRNSAYRRDWALRKAHELVLSKVEHPLLAVWGLAYKQNTHSIKNSPAVALLEALPGYPAQIFDPKVKSIPNLQPSHKICDSALAACSGADALIIMTPWPEFSKIPPSEIKKAMRGKIVIDPYGVLETAACRAAALSHNRLGRS